jgi:hypothetical protein
MRENNDSRWLQYLGIHDLHANSFVDRNACIHVRRGVLQIVLGQQLLGA